MNARLPIGVFDSGIGGLTVVRALAARLPHEHIAYFGDTARVPYGVKSVETIAHYATQITTFLLDKQVKLLIVACNTMAAVASQAIRAGDGQLFVAGFYFVFCMAMSRYSRWVEGHLNVGMRRQ